MKRSVWICLCIVSSVLLVHAFLFCVGVWVLMDLFAIIATSANGGEYQELSLGSLLINSIGSPLFYIALAELAVLILSVVMLVVTRKKRHADIENKE